METTHILAIQLEAPVEDAFFDGILPLCSPQKRARIEGMRLRRAAELSLMGEALMLFGMQKYMGIPADEIGVSFADGGKPFLLGKDCAFFNIAHSGNIAVCGISNREIGVDIEVVRDIDYISMAERIMTELELAAFAEAVNPERRFFEIWTLKESFAKHSGSGVASLLKTVNFAIGSDGSVASNIPGIFFRLYGDLEGYALAAASDRDILPGSVSLVTPKEIATALLERE